MVLRNKLLTSFFLLGIIGILLSPTLSFSRAGGGGSGSQVSTDQEHPLVHQSEDIEGLDDDYLRLDLTNDPTTGAELDLGSGNLTTTGQIGIGDSASFPLDITLEATDFRGINIDGETHDIVVGGFIFPVNISLRRDITLADSEEAITQIKSISSDINVTGTNISVTGNKNNYIIENRFTDTTDYDNPDNFERTINTYNIFNKNLKSAGSYLSTGTGALTINNYGLSNQVTDSFSITATGGATNNLNVYGIFNTVNGTPLSVTGSANITSFGEYINVIGNTNGTSIAYGLYINGVSGADTNFAVFDNSGALWQLGSSSLTTTGTITGGTLTDGTLSINGGDITNGGNATFNGSVSAFDLIGTNLLVDFINNQVNESFVDLTDTGVFDVLGNAIKTTGTGRFDSGLLDDNDTIAIDLMERHLIADDGMDIVLSFDVVGLAQFGDSNGITTGEWTANVFDMPTTASATVGVINQDNIRFIHTFGTANLFIGKNSGNFTLSGATNNTGVGENTLIALTSGDNNVALGWGALDSVTTASQNFGLGTSALAQLTTGGGSNVAIGTFSLVALDTGVNNIAIGRNSGVDLNLGCNSNIAIGAFTLDSTTATDNVDENVVIGDNAAGEFVSASAPKRNTIIGNRAGEKLAGDDNIFIGNDCGQDESGSLTLLIDSIDRGSEAAGRTGAIIFGVMNATPANQVLTFNALIKGTFGAQIGDGGTTDYVDIEADGDIVFVGGAGFEYGGISVQDNGTVTSVQSGAFTQFVFFDTNAPDNGGVTSDQANDQIIVTRAGDYKVTSCFVVENNAGAGHVVEMEIQANNGTKTFASLHQHRTLAAGTDKGAMSICGIVTLAVDDTIELWASSDSGAAKNITISDVSMSLVMVGGG